MLYHAIFNIVSQSARPALLSQEQLPGLRITAPDTSDNIYNVELMSFPSSDIVACYGISNAYNQEYNIRKNGPPEQRPNINIRPTYTSPTQHSAKLSFYPFANGRFLLSDLADRADKHDG